MHATAHTADLLAFLAGNLLFTRKGQERVLAAIAERLATAGEIYAHGEQGRLANVAATMVSRPDFDDTLWRAWVTDIDKGDQAVFQGIPPKIETVQRFENDTYFLHAIFTEISIRPATARSAAAKKTVLAVLRPRSAM